MRKKVKDGDTETAYRQMLARLLPQIRHGTLAFVVQDNRVIQINMTARESEVENEYGQTAS